MRLPSYRGAVRQKLEIYAHEHEEELKSMPKQEPINVTADALRNSPKLGPAPAAGQAAPLFDVQAVG